MMKCKKCVALLLAMLLALGSVSALADNAGKEEVIYGVLDAAGQVEGIYAVNIFGRGDIVDYGQYASVAMLNTQDTIAYADGAVTFHTDADRAYYQGDMESAELPWRFDLTYTLDGKPVTAEALAGAAGKVEIRLSVKENKACTGDFFRSHALQITASLDTDKFSSIRSEGGTQANVGGNRQISFILLPGTEKELLIAADTTCFEMDAIAINGIRMDLDLSVDTSTWDSDTASLQDAGVKLDDGAQSLLDGASELTGHNTELLDGAVKIIRKFLDAANETLAESRADFEELGITLETLTLDNYAAEIERLQSELLDKVDDKVYEEADRVLAQKVRAAARAKVQAQVIEVVRVTVAEQVTEAARAQVKAQVEAAARAQIEQTIRHPDDATLEAQIDQQMQTTEVQAQIEQAVAEQLSSPAVQAQIDSQLDAAIRPQVTAAVTGQLQSAVTASVRATIAAQVTAAYEAQFRQQAMALYPQPGTPSDLDDWNAQIDTYVAGCMADAAVQAAIIQQTDAKLAAAQADIDAEVAARLASAETQAAIDAEVARQAALPENRAQAESQAEAQIRPQVVAAVREQIRGRILGLSDEEVAALVEQQMATDSVQQRIQENTEAQMQSDAVKQRIATETDAQMASETVQVLISQNVEEQMNSGSVQSAIRSEITSQKKSSTYLDSVADALEENGENGEAYQALVTLRNGLDDLSDFYQGLIDYTDGVQELQDGTQEMKDGTAELREKTADIDTRVQDGIDTAISEKTGADVAVTSFTDARNTNVESVQFVLTTRAIKVEEEATAEDTQETETTETIRDRIRDLFH